MKQSFSEQTAVGENLLDNEDLREDEETVNSHETECQDRTIF